MPGGNRPVKPGCVQRRVSSRAGRAGPGGALADKRRYSPARHPGLHGGHTTGWQPPGGVRVRAAARVLTRRPGREERLRTSAATVRPGTPAFTEAIRQVGSRLVESGCVQRRVSSRAGRAGRSACGQAPLQSGPAPRPSRRPYAGRGGPGPGSRAGSRQAQDCECRKAQRAVRTDQRRRGLEDSASRLRLDRAPSATPAQGNGRGGPGGQALRRRGAR